MCFGRHWNPARFGSNELDLLSGKHHHPQKQPTASPALNVSSSISTIAITDRQIEGFQIQLGRSEKQIKIPERVEVAKVLTVCRDRVVIRLPHHLSAAKGVLQRLSEQPRKCQAEKLVADEIKKTHRLLLHRINQARAVGKVSLAGC